MKSQNFTMQYNRYSDLLMKIAFSMSKDSKLAEEIVQQVFISFYGQMDVMEEELYILWLMFATRRAVINYMCHGSSCSY